MNLTEDKNKLIEHIINRDSSSLYNVLCDPNNEEDYWNSVEQGKDLLEYDFHTVKEFKQLLSSELKEDILDDESIKIITVSTFKNKPVPEEHISTGDESNAREIDIPEFVYAF